MSRRKLAARTIRPLRLFLPRVEPLEHRVCPVVGGATYVPPVLPGTTPYDGVVSIITPATGGIGTGSLMTDGIHILTAAHVITTPAGGLTAQTVGFNVAAIPGRTLPNNVINYTVPVPAGGAGVFRHRYGPRLRQRVPGRGHCSFVAPRSVEPRGGQYIRSRAYYGEQPIAGANRAGHRADRLRCEERGPILSTSNSPLSAMAAQAPD